MARQIFTSRKLCCIVTSIAGCALIALVAIPMLGYEIEWLKRVQQSAANSICYNQILRKDEEVTKNISNHWKPETPSSSNQNFITAEENQEDTSNFEMSASNPSSNKNSLDAPSWMDLKTKEMSAEQLIDYFGWPNSTSCQLGHYVGGVWIGWSPRGIAGQKLVCILPNSLAPPPGSCIVYSFGIFYDWSFDDSMEQYGCQVFSFDPSMSYGDKANRSLGIHFYKIGLGAKDETSKEGWTIRTLGSIRRMLNHQDTVIDYLKIDIEFHEWAALAQLTEAGELSKIRQLGVEIHLPGEWSLDGNRERANVLRTMERDHGMVRFGSQLNPWSKYDWNITELRGIDTYYGYEIVWYNSKFLSAG